jgi:hypothetical protein
MSRKPAKPWFAPKRYGYGSGLPIAWQGWVVLMAYIAVCTGSSAALPFMFHNPTVSVWGTLAIAGVATVILFIICIGKTKGGWRWRAGEDD